MLVFVCVCVCACVCAWVYACVSVFMFMSVSVSVSARMWVWLCMCVCVCVCVCMRVCVLSDDRAAGRCSSDSCTLHTASEVINSYVREREGERGDWRESVCACAWVCVNRVCAYILLKDRAAGRSGSNTLCLRTPCGWFIRMCLRVCERERVSVRAREKDSVYI